MGPFLPVDVKHMIEMEGLTKRFGDFTAVDNLRLQVREGEIFGFLGPNGAGKTTTISMLTTLIKPTEGTAKIAGFDLLKEGVSIRAVIGVVPQSFALFPELTAQENLNYIGRLYGLSSRYIKDRSKKLLKDVSLWQHKDRIAGVFSGGMKQRLSLAASILSTPKILFMDEPTTGLDPQSRIAMRELTEQLNGQGMTIVYTTHDMEEAEKICDRITIMDHGHIVADGTAQELKDKIVSDRIILVELAAPSTSILAALRKLAYVSSVDQEGKHYTVRVHGSGSPQKLSHFLHDRRQKIIRLERRDPSLEDVFIQLTRKEVRD